MSGSAVSVNVLQK